MMDNIFKVGKAIYELFESDGGVRAAMMLLLSAMADDIEIGRRERDGENVGAAGIAVKSLCMAYAAVVGKVILDTGIGMSANDVIDGVLAVARLYIDRGEYVGHARPNVDLVDMLVSGLR